MSMSWAVLGFTPGPTLSQTARKNGPPGQVYSELGADAFIQSAIYSHPRDLFAGEPLPTKGAKMIEIYCVETS